MRYAHVLLIAGNYLFPADLFLMQHRNKTYIFAILFVSQKARPAKASDSVPRWMTHIARRTSLATAWMLQTWLLGRSFFHSHVSEWPICHFGIRAARLATADLLGSTLGDNRSDMCNSQGSPMLKKTQIIIWPTLIWSCDYAGNDLEMWLKCYFQNLSYLFTLKKMIPVSHSIKVK